MDKRYVTEDELADMHRRVREDLTYLLEQRRVDRQDHCRALSVAEQALAERIEAAKRIAECAYSRATLALKEGDALADRVTAVEEFQREHHSTFQAAKLRNLAGRMAVVEKGMPLAQKGFGLACILEKRVMALEATLDPPSRDRGATQLHCSNCGKVVSTAVPQETVIRAWIQCPECSEALAAEADPSSHAYGGLAWAGHDPGRAEFEANVRRELAREIVEFIEVLSEGEMNPRNSSYLMKVARLIKREYLAEGGKGEG